MNAQLGEVWYRYEDARYERDGTVITLREIPVQSHTEKGVWLCYGWGDKPRFVLKDAKKRYAYPTQAEAMAAFIKRKERQIQLLSSQHDQAVEALALAKAPKDLTRQLGDYLQWAPSKLEAFMRTAAQPHSLDFRA